jgi:hypothetical protein
MSPSRGNRNPEGEQAPDTFILVNIELSLGTSQSWMKPFWNDSLEKLGRTAFTSPSVSQWGQGLQHLPSLYQPRSGSCGLAPGSQATSVSISTPGSHSKCFLLESGPGPPCSILDWACLGHANLTLCSAQATWDQKILPGCDGQEDAQGEIYMAAWWAEGQLTSPFQPDQHPFALTWALCNLCPQSGLRASSGSPTTLLHRPTSRLQKAGSCPHSWVAPCILHASLQGSPPPNSIPMSLGQARGAHLG